MKLIQYTVAGTLLLAAPILSADDKKTDQFAVTHLVEVSTAVGSALWDHQGNQIGSISNILLNPTEPGMILAVVDVDWLDEERQVVVPWNKLYIRTKEGEADEIIYTLDTTKEVVQAAPVFTSKQKLSGTQGQEIYRYWKVEQTADGVKHYESKTIKKTGNLDVDVDDVEDFDDNE